MCGSGIEEGYRVLRVKTGVQVATAGLMFDVLARLNLELFAMTGKFGLPVFYNRFMQGPVYQTFCPTLRRNGHS